MVSQSLPYSQVLSIWCPYLLVYSVHPPYLNPALTNLSLIMTHILQVQQNVREVHLTLTQIQFIKPQLVF